MATMRTDCTEIKNYRVVHPMDDAPETKRQSEGLEPMKMTPSVKVSLMALRGYLIAMTFMLVYHVLGLAGVFRR